jgi:hypothetical protein
VVWSKTTWWLTSSKLFYDERRCEASSETSFVVSAETTVTSTGEEPVERTIAAEAPSSSSPGGQFDEGEVRSSIEFSHRWFYELIIASPNIDVEAVAELLQSRVTGSKLFAQGSWTRPLASISPRNGASPNRDRIHPDRPEMSSLFPAHRAARARHPTPALTSDAQRVRSAAVRGDCAVSSVERELHSRGAMLR